MRGSPGLVAMGEDSFSGGRWLDSQHRLLDGHFLHLFVVSLLYLFVKGKINKKRLEIANFYYSNVYISVPANEE